MFDVHSTLVLPLVFSFQCGSETGKSTPRFFNVGAATMPRFPSFPFHNRNPKKFTTKNTKYTKNKGTQTKRPAIPCSHGTMLPCFNSMWERNGKSHPAIPRRAAQVGADRRAAPGRKSRPAVGTYPTPASRFFNVGAADGPKGLCEPQARAKRQPCRDPCPNMGAKRQPPRDSPPSAARLWSAAA